MRVKRMQQGGDVEALLRALEKRRAINSLNNQQPQPPRTDSYVAPADATSVRPSFVVTPEQAAMDQLRSANMWASDLFSQQPKEFDPAAGQGIEPFYLADIIGPSGDVKDITEALQGGEYGSATAMAALAFTPIPAKAVKLLREGVPMVFRRADFSEIADEVLEDISEVPNVPSDSGLNDPFDIEELFFSHSRASERLADMDVTERSQFFDDFEDLAASMDMDDPKLADQLRKSNDALQTSVEKIIAQTDGIKVPDKVFRTGGNRPMEFKLSGGVSEGRLEYTGYDLTHNGTKYDTIAEYERGVGRRPDKIGSADLTASKNYRSLYGDDVLSDYQFNIKLPSDASATTALILMRKLLNSVPNGKIIEAGGSLSADSYPFVMHGLKSGKAELAVMKGAPEGVAFKPLNAMGENYTALPKMLGIPREDVIKMFEGSGSIQQKVAGIAEKRELWDKHKDTINAALKEYGLPEARWSDILEEILMPHPYLRKLKDYKRGGMLTVKKKNNNTFRVSR